MTPTNNRAPWAMRRYGQQILQRPLQNFQQSPVGRLYQQIHQPAPLNIPLDTQPAQNAGPLPPQPARIAPQGTGTPPPPSTDRQEPVGMGQDSPPPVSVGAPTVGDAGLENPAQPPNQGIQPMIPKPGDMSALRAPQRNYLDGKQQPSIEPMAAGGIISKPTIAMLGERGPEAVVPLTPSSNARLRPGGFLKARYQRPIGPAASQSPLRADLPLVPNRTYR